MEVLTVCMQCQIENGVPNFASFRMSAIPDDLIIRQVCVAGHVTHTVLQNDRFELLSELALLALIDGYYREAVVNFSAMIERLHEFYIRVVAEKRGISEDTLRRIWKTMVSQSERQLGAFAMAYTFEHGEPAPQLRADTEVKFRNDVVHKGKFPTRAETVAYGQACFDLAHVILSSIKVDDYQDAVRTVVGFRLRDGYASARTASANPSTHGMATPICLSAPNLSADLEEAIAAIIARPPMSQLADLAATLRALVSQSTADGTPEAAT